MYVVQDASDQPNLNWQNPYGTRYIQALSQSFEIIYYPLCFENSS